VRFEEHDGQEQRLAEALDVMEITSAHIGAALVRVEGRLDDYLLTMMQNSGLPVPPGHHLSRPWITFAVTVVAALGLLA
jgi:hypothetical protein